MYRDPISELIITKLKAASIPGIKEFYNGDLITPAKTDLPLIYVAKDNTNITQATNMEDDYRMAYVATTVYDMTGDIGQSHDLAAGASGLYEIVEGRNANYTPKANTIAYVLRSNQVLAEKLWIDPASPVTATYGIGVNRRGPGIFSVEAVVRFTVRSHVARPGL